MCSLSCLRFLCVCMLSSCLKMKRSQVSLAWKAWKASEAEGVQGLQRAGECTQLQSKARIGWRRRQAFLSWWRPLPCGLTGKRTDRQMGGAAAGIQEPARSSWASPAWPVGKPLPTALAGRRNLMLSLNSTKVQSYNIWDF